MRGTHKVSTRATGSRVTLTQRNTCRVIYLKQLLKIFARVPLRALNKREREREREVSNGNQLCTEQGNVRL